MKEYNPDMIHNLCWIRRDLRLHDHHALSQSLHTGQTTLVFVFDTHILNNLSDKSDRRITFIYESLLEIETLLKKKSSSLIILFGKPEEEIPKLAESLRISTVYCNRDYEPYAKKRDAAVESALAALEHGAGPGGRCRDAGSDTRRARRPVDNGPELPQPAEAGSGVRSWCVFLLL